MPERRTDPWILQFFIYDEPHLEHFSKRVHDYRMTHGEKNRYSDNWLRTLDAHLSDASAEKGMFRKTSKRPGAPESATTDFAFGGERNRASLTIPPTT